MMSSNRNSSDTRFGGAVGLASDFAGKHQVVTERLMGTPRAWAVPGEAQVEAIRASAGSGKTYELTNRYLRQVVQQAPLHQILATTFTRKAAGEILERVLKRLAAAVLRASDAQSLSEAIGKPQLSTSEFSHHLMMLVQNLHRVSISTIDSFFNKLASGFKYELGLPPDLRLLDQAAPLATQMRLDSIRALLSSEASVIPLIEGWFQRPVRSITGALDREFQQLYDVFRQSRLEDWQRLTFEPGLEPSQLERNRDIVADALARATGKQLPRALTKVLTLLDSGAYRDLLSGSLVGDAHAGKSTYYNVELDPVLFRALQALGQHAKSKLMESLSIQTESTGHLLQRFDEIYSQIRHDNGVVLFSDLPLRLAQRARELQAEPVAHRLDTPVHHLLLDEFQDTSPEQWAVLLPVAQQVREQKGSLFCVGDVKQAIYGWRGGVAEIFNQLQDDLPELSWSTRARSFRSSKVVLDAVNAVFQHLSQVECLQPHLTVARRWQEGYETHEAALDRPGYVELRIGPGESETPEGEEDEEGAVLTPGGLERSVASEVAALARQLPERTIGVLVRTNEAVRRLLFLLQQENVEASGEGGNAIVDDPAVEVVLAAFQLADHPGDGVASWRLKHSPLRPILQALADQQGDGWSTAKIASIIRKNVLDQGFAPLISEWARTLAPLSTPRSVRRLLQLVELANRYDPDRGLRPSEFVSFVRAATVEEPSPARVRVMTVHKAKGLEFDVVFLLELDKQLLGMSPALLVDRPQPTQPLKAVYRNAAKEVRALDPGLMRAYDQYVQREVSEGLCELYVAMTRARFALFMTVKARSATKSGLRKVSLSHAGILRGTLLNRDEIETPAGNLVLYADGDPAWASKLEVSAPIQAPSDEKGAESGGADGTGESHRAWRISLAKTQHSHRSLRVINPSGLEKEASVQIDDLLRTDDDPAIKQGVILHAWMQQLEWLDRQGEPDDAALEAVAAPLGLRRGGAPLRFSDRHVVTLEMLLKRFRQTLLAPEVRQRLTHPSLRENDALQLWRERAFVVRLEQRLVKGSFDRVEVVMRDGRPSRAVVLDYKSDAISAQGQGMRGASLQERLERYRPQLHAYQQALSRILDLPVERIAAQILWLQPGIISQL